MIIIWDSAIIDTELKLLYKDLDRELFTKVSPGMIQALGLRLMEKYIITILMKSMAKYKHQGSI